MELAGSGSPAFSKHFGKRACACFAKGLRFCQSKSKAKAQTKSQALGQLQVRLGSSSGLQSGSQRNPKQHIMKEWEQVSSVVLLQALWTTKPYYQEVWVSCKASGKQATCRMTQPGPGPGELASRGQREFSALLLEVDSTSSGLLMYNNVRWLSRGKVLEHFVECFEEIKVFLDDKDLGNFPQLNDDKWVNTLMFFTDLSVHINELNLKLQGFGKSIDIMFGYIKAFESKVKIFKRDVETKTYKYFRRVTKYSEKASAAVQNEMELLHMKYQHVLDSLLDQFGDRFSQFRSLEQTMKIIKYPDVVVYSSLELNGFQWMQIDDLEMQLAEFQDSIWAQVFVDMRSKLENLERRPLQKLSHSRLKKRHTWVLDQHVLCLHASYQSQTLSLRCQRRHELSVCAMAVLRHRQASGAASRAGVLEVWRRRAVGGLRGSPGRSLAAVGPQEHVAAAPAFLGRRQRQDPGLGSGRRRTTPPPRLALGAQGLRSCRPADRQLTRAGVGLRVANWLAVGAGGRDSRVPDPRSSRRLKRPALLRPVLRKTLVAELGVADCVAAGTSFPPAAVFLWPPARSERLRIGVPLGVADRAGGRRSDQRVARGKLLLADNWCRQPDYALSEEYEYSNPQELSQKNLQKAALRTLAEGISGQGILTSLLSASVLGSGFKTPQ
ncbi:hypothetical protein QTO34_016906 [Cnephaeus nilssonii]|uniref:General transcription factor II-I repeat domain-containing protein 2 n=1 Tax=Cnephaeus nilssonii TaxID=3371016 RepID=A0AA40LSL2_CNENI|nr:hypothetical protein QTO34_016906 [Eptesicus nilssonii]